MTWLPIKDAPKDGTTIILMNWHEIIPEIYSAWWAPFETKPGGFHVDYEVDYDGHYWVLNDDADQMIEEDNDLTTWFWAPLDPPKDIS